MKAIEKIKHRITGDPNGVLEFQHSGPNVIRWISPDQGPSAKVTFDDQGEKTITRCPYCKQELGDFYSDYRKGTNIQLREICKAANKHQCSTRI